MLNENQNNEDTIILDRNCSWYIRYHIEVVEIRYMHITLQWRPKASCGGDPPPWTEIRAAALPYTRYKAENIYGKDKPQKIMRNKIVKCKNIDFLPKLMSC